MAQENQTGILYQPREVRWGGRWEGGSKGWGYMYTYGWFMLRFDRKQQKSVNYASIIMSIIKSIIMLQLKKKKKRMERCDLTEAPGRLWVGLFLGRGKDWVLADFVQTHVWCTWFKTAMPGWPRAQPLCTWPASHHLELQCCVQCFIARPAQLRCRWSHFMLGTLLWSVGCVACAWSKHPMSKWN